jgi:glycosyltransferase involved in cell wall biosynthesis
VPSSDSPWRRRVTSLARSARRRARPVRDLVRPRNEATEVTARLEQLTEARDHLAAIALAEANLDRFASDKAFLRQVRTTASRAGAMSLQRRATELQLRLGHDPRLRRLADELEGRWRETSADWSPVVDPAVAATLEPVTDPVPGRVVHVVKVTMPYRQSGYSVRTMYSLSAQAEVGLEPIAVTPLDFPQDVPDGPEEEWVGGVRHLRLRRDRVPDHEPFDRYLEAWATALAPVVASLRPEVLHVHSGHRGYESALVALAVGDLLGVPVVYEVRGFFESLWTSDVAWAEQSETYRRRRDTETRCMTRAAAVVTLSESMRGDIVERGVDPDRVHVVPNGVDTDTFSPRPRSQELVDRYGLAGSFVFGYVSNLDHYREGQELLVEAAVELRRRGVPATALVVGDGRRRSLLERRAAEVDAGSAVVFTGSVPHAEVLDYYTLCDVFVVPRIDERAARLVTPLKPLEAMALQVPLLVSDLPALREIIGGGARGSTFRAGDVASLADELERLYRDPERARQLAAEARRWVETERRWEVNGARYQEVYRSVLGAGPGA